MNEEKSSSGTAGDSSAKHPDVAHRTRRADKQQPSSSPAPKPKKRKGFWSAFLAILVPCSSPSRDLTEGVSEPVVQQRRDDASDTASAPLKEKADLQPHVHSVEPSSSSTTVTAPPHASSTAAQHSASDPPANDHLAVPPPAASPFSPAPGPASDAQVIVPPVAKILPKAETEGVTSGAVQAPGSTGEEEESTDGSGFTDEEGEEHKDVDEMEDEEDRLIMQGGVGIPIGPDGQPRPLLPPVLPQHQGRKCLVLDLDETLVHSSFKLIPQADYVVPVEIEWQWHNVYVIKRPGVDNFLRRMGELYEVVVFTASLSKYADPVLDKLDIHKVVTHRLFRESCYNHKGNYVKDLSQLGRPMTGTIILDNSPASYIFHPNNAVPVSSWFNDPHDTELTDLCPFLADLRTVDDVRGVLDGGL